MGLLIMSLRAFSGEGFDLIDIGIQLGALILFGGLLWSGRRKGS